MIRIALQANADHALRGRKTGEQHSIMMLHRVQLIARWRKPMSVVV
jgi:hypothetical protein